MNVIYWTIAIFTLYCATVKACQENQTCPIDVTDPNIQAILTGMSAFTEKLLRALYTDETVIGNIALSALSVYFSLAVMLFGSTDRTLALLNGALGLPVDTDWKTLKDDMKAILDALEVTRTETIDSQNCIYENVFLGQAIFLQNGFYVQDAYVKFLELIGAQLYWVDFTVPKVAVQTIKDWVATQTSKEVNVGVDKPFAATSRILMASTVFFTAKWEEGLFPKDKHGWGQFETERPKKIVQVGTMSTDSVRTFQYLDVPGYYTALQLPYKGGDNTMLIVLPYKDYGIWKFANDFGMNDYNYIIKNSGSKKALVTIPKFKGVWTSTLGKYLIENMGLIDIFKYAQLGNMIQNFQGGIEVAEMLHGAAMELDESGTTVSTISENNNMMFGASLMSVQSEAPVEIPIEFIVDRAFLMYIHNIQTGLPIFSALMRDFGGDPNAANNGAANNGAAV